MLKTFSSLFFTALGIWGTVTAFVVPFDYQRQGPSATTQLFSGKGIATDYTWAEEAFEIEVSVKVPKDTASDQGPIPPAYRPTISEPVTMSPQSPQPANMKQVPIMSMPLTQSAQDTNQYELKHHGKRYRSTYSPSASRFSSASSSMQSGSTSYDTSRPPGCIEWIMNSRCSHGDCMPLLTMASASRYSRSSSSDY